MTTDGQSGRREFPKYLENNTLIPQDGRVVDESLTCSKDETDIQSKCGKLDSDRIKFKLDLRENDSYTLQPDVWQMAMSIFVTVRITRNGLSAAQPRPVNMNSCI